MTKDSEPQIDLKTKFTLLEESILQKLTASRDPDSLSIISIKRWGKDAFHALVLEANGRWSGRGYQMETDLGDPISLGAILREYAIIKDRDYVDIILRNGFDKKDTYYIASHRRRLLQGLVSDMEARLGELTT